MVLQDAGEAVMAAVFVMWVEETRDGVIIAAGAMFFLAFFVAAVVALVVGVAARKTLGSVQSVLSNELTPLLNSTRQTLKTVQGTTAFISEAAVTPIVRTYGVVAGTRRVMGVLTGVTGARKRRR